MLIFMAFHNFVLLLVQGQSSNDIKTCRETIKVDIKPTQNNLLYLDIQLLKVN